jgi:hypothetical protein
MEITREFEELALDGHNYPSWTMDVKISLTLCGVYEAILPPEERIVSLLDQFKYNALYIIRNHLHIDLKSKYVLEEQPNVLWAALQTHYEQQNVMILPEANRYWTMLRLYDFKLFIQYVQGCGFERKNLQKRIKLKKHFKLCFLWIESCNINTMPRITKLTQILFMISSKQKSMISLH